MTPEELRAKIAERKRQIASSGARSEEPDIVTRIFGAPPPAYNAERDSPEYRARVDSITEGLQAGGGDFGRRALSSATFGFSDKIASGAAAAITALPALLDERDYLEVLGEDYSANKDAMRAANREYGERAPASAIAADIGGALIGGAGSMQAGGAMIRGAGQALGPAAGNLATRLTTTATTTGGRLAQNIALGAGMGAAYAAGSDLDIEKNALAGAALGPVGAAAVRGGVLAARRAPAITGALAGAGVAKLADADRETQIEAGAVAGALASRPGRRALGAALKRLTGQIPRRPASDFPADAPLRSRTPPKGGGATPPAEDPVPTVKPQDLTIARTANESPPPVRRGLVSTMRESWGRMKAAADARRERIGSLGSAARAGDEKAAAEIQALRAENKILVDTLNKTRNAMARATESAHPPPRRGLAPESPVKVASDGTVVAKPNTAAQSAATQRAAPQAPPPQPQEIAAVQAQNANRAGPPDAARATIEQAQDVARTLDVLEDTLAQQANWSAKPGQPGVRDVAGRVANEVVEDPTVLRRGQEHRALEMGAERGNRGARRALRGMPPEERARGSAAREIYDAEGDVPGMLQERAFELRDIGRRARQVIDMIRSSGKADAPEFQGALQRAEAIAAESDRLATARYPGGDKLLPSEARRLEVDDGNGTPLRQLAENLNKSVRETLDRLGLSDVDFQLVTDDVMRALTGESARGASVQGGTKLLLNIDRMTENTVTHEVVHSLKQLGLLRENEFAAMLKAARNGFGADRVNALRQQPAYRELSDDVFDEEVVAQYFGPRLKQAVDGKTVRATVAKNVANRLVTVGRELRAALSREGVDADTVLDRMARGAVGKRGRGTPRSVRAFKDAGGDLNKTTGDFLTRYGSNLGPDDIQRTATAAARAIDTGDIDRGVMILAKATGQKASVVRREIMGDIVEVGWGGVSGGRAGLSAYANPATVAERERYDRAREFGITLSKGQQSRTATQQGLEEGYRTGAYGPSAEDVMRRFDDRQGQQIGEAVDTLSREFGGEAGTANPYDSMAGVISGVSKARSARRGHATRKYARVDQEAGYVEFQDGEALADAVETSLKEQALDFGAKAKAVVTLLRTAAARAKERGQRMTFKDFDSIRSKALAAERTAAGTPDAREVRIAVDAMDDWFDQAIESGAVSARDGGANLMRFLKDARKYYRKYKEAFFPGKNQGSIEKRAKTVLQKMADGEMTPEQVVSDVIGINNVGATPLARETLKQLKSVLNYGNRKGPSPEWQSVRAAAFRLLVSKPVNQVTLTPERQAARIEAFLDGPGGTVSKILFEPDELAKIRRFGKVLRDASTDKNARDTFGVTGGIGRMAHQVAQSIFGAMAGSTIGEEIGGTPGAMLGAVLGAGAGSPVARAVSNMTGQRAAMNATRGAAAPMTPVAEGALNLSSALARAGLASTGGRIAESAVRINPR